MDKLLVNKYCANCKYYLFYEQGYFIAERDKKELDYYCILLFTQKVDSPSHPDFKIPKKCPYELELRLESNDFSESPPIIKSQGINVFELLGIV